MEKEGGLTESEEPRAQRADPRTIKKNSWEVVEMGSDQGTFGICPTGFQNCYGPVTPVCFPFTFWEQASVQQLLSASPTTACWVCGGR